MHAAARRRRLYLVVASMSLVLVVVGFMASWHRGIAVSIANQMDGELTNVTIDYTGGQLQIARIGGGSTFEATIVPKSESSLVLHYTDALNNTRTAKVDVYIEPNHTGTIQIVVLPNGQIE